MWIFCKSGFFSAVEFDEDSSKLVVRARIAGDLERLKEQYMGLLGPTVQLPGRDYPYRAYISKPDFADGLLRMAGDIDYTNFKGMVMAVYGLAREKLYAKVWGVMYGADDVVNRKKAAR